MSDGMEGPQPRYRLARAFSRILSAEGQVPPSQWGGGGRRPGIVDCAVYERGVRLAGTYDYRQALKLAGGKADSFVWLALHDSDPEEVGEIAEVFGLNLLIVEDVFARPNPKIETFGDVTVLLLRSARYVDHEQLRADTEVIETGQVVVIVGERFVISIRDGVGIGLSSVRAELEAEPRALRDGPWAVALAILDRVMDGYLGAVDAVSSDLGRLESDLVDRSGGAHTQAIYQLKRELLEFKRAVVPLQRPLSTFLRERGGELPEAMDERLREFADRLSRSADEIIAMDDKLTVLTTARIAQVDVDQNNDMRKISAWVSIGAIWGILPGVYQMTDDFPTLHGKHAVYTFWGFVGFAVIFSIGLYRTFRRNGWL